MKISCPSCGASFNVKAEALGASGRKVKCGKCAHQWHALPDGASAAAPESPPAPPTVETPFVDTRVAETSPVDAPPEPTPSEFAADLASEIAKEQQSETPPLEQETDFDAVAAPAADMTVAPEIDTDPFPRIDIPATEPDAADVAPPTIPESLMAAPEATPSSNKEKSAPRLGRRLGRGVLVSAGVAAAVVIILVGGAIFLQPQITTMIPAAASLYARMGLQSDVPGLGLTIVEPKPGKRDDGGDEVLEVVGVIRNDTKEAMDIPVMQARLLDGNGAPLNVWLFRAAKSKIAAGETVEYKTEFRNPPAKAERLDITFTSKTNVPELARNPAPDMKKSSDAKAPSKHDK